MRLDPYPPQEPLSGRMFEYQAELLARSLGIHGEELAYGPSRLQRIEVFLPDNPNGTVLAVFPGGGWTNAYKDYLSHMAPAMTAAGIILTTVGYRLAPEHTFPTGIEDCAAGLNRMIEFLRGRGLPTDRVFLGGHSAGGHIAALLAVSSRPGGAFGLAPGVVRGCLPISGSYDLTAAGGFSSRPRFLGLPGNEEAASPIHRIGARPVPFHVAWASNDFPHLIAQAQRFVRALTDAGGMVETFVLDGDDHFSAGYAGMPGRPWTEAAIAWMGRN